MSLHATASPRSDSPFPHPMAQTRSTAGSQRRKERALVAGILAGDEASFDELHALYRDRIYRFALKRLRNAAEAEDVCQDVFLQVFRCIGSYQGRSSLLTWMFGIAHHQVCRRYRRRSFETLSLDAPQASEVTAPSTPAEQQLDVARLFEDCNRVLEEEVGEGQRKVFELRYAENYSTRDIAEELGKSNQAIKISLFRTRRILAAGMDNLADVLSA